MGIGIRKNWNHYCYEKIDNDRDFEDEENRNHRRGQITMINMEIKKYLMEIAKKKKQ